MNPPAGSRLWSGIRRHRVVSALIVAAVGLVVWRMATDLASRSRQLPPAAASVVLATVAARDMPEKTSAVGTVLATSTVSVESMVAGQVVAADFTEGQMVAKGQTLFQIDPRPFQAALDQAQAALARDQAQLASARQDLRRYTILARKKYFPVQQRDQAAAQVAALVADVASDKAAVEIARLNLGYTDIRAPIAGKTGAILIHPGNLVKADDTANPMVTIAAIEPVRLSFALPQQDLPRIEPLLAAHALTAVIAVGGQTLSGRVDFLSNAVDAATGTVELRATIANPRDRLVPGEFVPVTVGMGVLKKALVVPDAAVNTGEHGRFVYVDEHGKAANRPVEVVYDDGTDAAVKGDLKPGEKVVVDGQLKVAPGVRLIPRPPVGGASSSRP